MKNRWIVPIAFLPLLGLVPMQAAGMEGTVMTTACGQPGAAAEKLLSPDGRICLTYSEVQGNGISFNLSYTGKQGQTEVMTLPYTGMQTRKGRGAGLRLERVDKPVHISENYTMLTGKRKVCSNEAEEYLSISPIRWASLSTCGCACMTTGSLSAMNCRDWTRIHRPVN